MARNSDGSYDAVDSGGFGKDYHGQDAFGERIGGTGIGGSHFGGFEEGHVGLDKDNTGKYEKLSSEALAQTEAPDMSAFEGEANEVADSMRESIRGVNEETAENSNTGSTMDTSFQIGGIEEDKEKYQQEYERAEEGLNRVKEALSQTDSYLDKQSKYIDKMINQLDNNSTTGKISNDIFNPQDAVIDKFATLARLYNFDDFDRIKIEDEFKEKGTEVLRNAKDELFERAKAYKDKTLKEYQDKLDRAKRLVDSYKSSTTDKTKTSFTDKMKPSTEAKATEAKAGTNMSNAKTSPSDYLTKANKDSTKEVPKESPSRNDFGNHAVDTLKGVVDRISGSVTPDKAIDDLVSLAQRYGYTDFDRNRFEEAYKENGINGLRNVSKELFEEMRAYADKEMKDVQDDYDYWNSKVESFKSSTTDKTKPSFTGSVLVDKAIDDLTSLAQRYGYTDFDRNKFEEAYKENGFDGLRKAKEELFGEMTAYADKEMKDAQDNYDHWNSKVESTTEEDKETYKKELERAEAQLNTIKGWNDYYRSDLAKADNAFKGVADRISGSVTADALELTEEDKETYKKGLERSVARLNTTKGWNDKVRSDLAKAENSFADSISGDALGLKSIEEFAQENGLDPNKLSTMKAYQSYQNKEIMKAIPGIVKQIGSYITERVKDAVDPSQLPERIRNTLARYNLATLIGAAILSIKSGAGLQASIDQALTMVDTEDQPAVSDYLEDALNDEGTVNDLSNAFDDALAPEQNSATAELDESIVNLGRKDNTDYSGFNAGLGTTSDADVKVFIARNVKADPILRKMISKIGK